MGENLLQHRVAVETELVLDHAVGHLTRHLSLRHLVLWKICRGEFGAIDTSSELIFAGQLFEVELLETWNDLLVEVLLRCNCNCRCSNVYELTASSSSCDTCP